MGSAIVKNLAVFGAEPDGEWVAGLRELQDIWGASTIPGARHQPRGRSGPSPPISRKRSIIAWCRGRASPLLGILRVVPPDCVIGLEILLRARMAAGKDSPTRLGRCMAATGDLLDRL